MIRKLKTYQFLFEELVKRDFKAKYKRTVLGMAWSILSPLLTLLIIILGGINPAGGKGKLGGVVIAILTLQVLSSLFNIQRLDSNFKTFVFGCVLAAVMVMEYWGELGLSKRRKT